MHTGSMRTLTKCREEHPNTTFQTRSLPCADKVTRIVALPLWYWEKLDVLLSVDCNNLDTITRYCLALADKAVRDEGWEFDTAFRELLMYYIYRNYQGYVAVNHHLANDNRDECFTNNDS